jgi:NADH-quinone oxidoreductase subunit G
VHLGNNPRILTEIVAGGHPFAQTLREVTNPMIIVGQGALARRDGAAILAQARKLAEGYGMVRDDWRGFNVLHTAASRVGGLDLGLVPGPGGRDVAGIVEGAESGAIEVVYLLGADEIDTSRLKRAFVIYQGHHGDRGAAAADVVLPGAAYTEKNATYVNTEGRVQRAKLAVFPPGDAREDWTILRALAEALNLHKALPYDNLAELRQRMVRTNEVFTQTDTIEPSPWGAFGTDGAVDKMPFEFPVRNYYMTDPISRVSPTMARCTEAFVLRGRRTGTHG